jgi:glycine/D-amino acid oxidase-like deaminating enzyme
MDPHLTLDYRGLSFWHDTVPGDLHQRTPLDGDVHTDVAIIGGGLTGLWAAHYLLARDGRLAITVIEKEIAGFGASGRNGGWCSALFPRSTASLERAHGRSAAIAMRRAMIDTVDEVGRVTAAEGIDCHFVKGGTLAFARSAAQLRSARAEVAEAALYGVDALELRGSGGAAPGRTRGARGSRNTGDPGHSRLGASGALGAVFDPACARLHPARLVRGLAASLERRGVNIVEGTEVTSYAPGAIHTTRGTVYSPVIIQATEGYGAMIAQSHRDILPLYSLMVATEPLPDEFWQRVGIAHGQTFTDFRHLLVYGQRTADNRFAFGGRGARYHWGSAVNASYDRSPTVFEHLRRTLVDLFPDAADAAITHRWGGPLGVPRDWHASVRFDPATGLGSAGGYVGDGLSTTNLAGRTLADLITRTDSSLVRLPWVGHQSPRWEPEPLRFAAANAGLLAMGVADAEERVTGRPSIAARAMGPLVGH